MYKASLKISTNRQTEIEPKTCIITITTVAIPPHQISIVPLKATNQAINAKFTSETLLEIEGNPFLTKEQPALVLVHTLQRLASPSPRHLHGSVMESQRSKFNTKMEHDHRLC